MLNSSRGLLKMDAEDVLEVIGFLNVYPEFESVKLEKVVFTLANSKALIQESLWDEFTLQARYLLTAHNLSTATQGTTVTGIINKLKIDGDIEIGSVVGTPKDSWELSSYGRELTQLKASVVGGFITCTLM
jgi:hypothetical protein